jgi:hypothetical protein
MRSHPLSNAKPLVFNIAKIKTVSKLRDAFKHNKREIAYENNCEGSIDPSRTRFNYSLTGAQDSTQLTDVVNQAIFTYVKHTGKQLQSNAVVAVEVMFSVSAAYTAIDLTQYFQECFDWAVEDFAPATVLTADVHLDESNPHMHIIFLCVTATNLVASAVVGYKGKQQERLMSLYRNVARKHGLELPLRGLSKANKIKLAGRVIESLEHSDDPLTHSKLYPTTKEAIRQNPAPFAFSLGVAVDLKPAKMRTVAEIFTSTGRGSRTVDGT